MKPTDSELSILTVLWKDGPSTVRHVNDELNRIRHVGYTNTLKMMQLMHDKGFLDRDESSRSHIYRALINPDAVQQHMVKNVVNAVFGGNTGNLLLHAMGNYKPSREELEKIKSMIEKWEDNG